MKTKLIRIGQGRGIRLPETVIGECGFGNEVEMEVHHRELVIRPARHNREGWDAAFATMSELEDDKLLDLARVDVFPLT